MNRQEYFKNLNHAVSGVTVESSTHLAETLTGLPWTLDEDGGGSAVLLFTTNIPQTLTTIPLSIMEVFHAKQQN